MPIKIKDDLPATKILEDEQYICDDRTSCADTGYSSVKRFLF